MHDLGEGGGGPGADRLAGLDAVRPWGRRPDCGTSAAPTTRVPCSIDWPARWRWWRRN